MYIHILYIYIILGCIGCIGNMFFPSTMGPWDLLFHPRDHRSDLLKVMPCSWRGWVRLGWCPRFQGKRHHLRRLHFYRSPRILFQHKAILESTCQTTWQQGNMWWKWSKWSKNSDSKLQLQTLNRQRSAVFGSGYSLNMPDCNPQRDKRAGKLIQRSSICG